MSLTSPIDTLRSSAVSKHFLSASKSDVIWNKFMPSNFDGIVAQSSSPSQFLQRFTSKKKQYIYLCTSHILLNNDTQSFALDKWSGKECYMFGARALNIMGGETHHLWAWESLPESRFPEIARLVYISELLIEARIDPTTLSQNTGYGAYFVYKMDVNSRKPYGFIKPIKLRVYEVVVEEDGSENPQRCHVPYKLFEIARTPYVRDDGWIEIEMGRYYYVQDFVDDKVMLAMSVTDEREMHNWKSGLIVEGIELRPLH